MTNSRPTPASNNGRSAALSQALISSEAARSAQRWEALHAIDPGGKTRSDDIVLDEIRSAASEPQQERHERIDREIDRREFTGQIVAGRGVLP